GPPRQYQCLIPATPSPPKLLSRPLSIGAQHSTVACATGCHDAPRPHRRPEFPPDDATLAPPIAACSQTPAWIGAAAPARRCAGTSLPTIRWKPPAPAACRAPPPPSRAPVDVRCSRSPVGYGRSPPRNSPLLLSVFVLRKVQCAAEDSWRELPAAPATAPDARHVCHRRRRGSHPRSLSPHRAKSPGCLPPSAGCRATPAW